MKKIGMVGGLSWYSSAEYYRLLNEIAAERLGGAASAHLIMESVNRAPYVDAVIRRKDEAAAEQIVCNAVKSVEAGGADFIILCCNDIHRFVPAIRKQIDIPFLHIADATAEAIKKQDLKTIGLLGVLKTMEDPFYADVLAGHGIATIVPGKEERHTVQSLLMDRVLKGEINDDVRNGFLGVIERLRHRSAEGVVLGCTEIPLVIKPEHVDLPVFSTTDIHCSAAMDYALS